MSSKENENNAQNAADDYEERKVDKSISSSNSDASKEKSKKILLCCFLNKYSRNVTLDFLYSIFSKYGKVLKVSKFKWKVIKVWFEKWIFPGKILIFERARIWKFFVEMSTLEEAMEVKNSMNNKGILDESSRLNIHFSNLSELSFPDKSPLGKSMN